jgi:hypothetical protein
MNKIIWVLLICLMTVSLVTHFSMAATQSYVGTNDIQIEYLSVANCSSPTPGNTIFRLRDLNEGNILSTITLGPNISLPADKEITWESTYSINPDNFCSGNNNLNASLTVCNSQLNNCYSQINSTLGLMANCNDVSQQAGEYRARYESCNADYGDCNTKFTTSQTSLSAAQSDANTCKSELTSCNRNVDTYSTQVTTLKSDNDSLAAKAGQNILWAIGGAALVFFLMRNQGKEKGVNPSHSSEEEEFDYD